MNMIRMLNSKIRSYADFLSKTEALMKDDLRQAYPDLVMESQYDIPDLLNQTGDSFVFVIDEWDAIFEYFFMTQADRQNYLEFLRSLFKDNGTICFAYMTGIRPIAQYTSGSPLNMFREFSAFQDNQFYPYFGLSEEEIQELMQMKGIPRPSVEELTFWYDGYSRPHDGKTMFNPEFVSCALMDGRCESYWTGTGPMNEVRDSIRHNVMDLREDVVRLAVGLQR